MKLYRVICKGMHGSITGPRQGIAYVLAKDPTEAYNKLRAYLDAGDIGFRKDRELDRIELIADEDPTTDAGTMVFL